VAPGLTPLPATPEPGVHPGLVARLGRAAEAHPRLVVAGAMLASCLAVYAPFLGAPDHLVRYWDGPHYMYVARTLYHVPADHPFTVYGLPPAYFASHFPGYPLLIRGLTLVTAGSYPVAMILATLLSAVGAALLFHEVLRRYDLVVSPVWTGALFAVIPPRWILYHSVGASEPLFLCAIFAALLALRAERPWRVALFLAAACLTRVVGVVFVGGFVLLYLIRRQWLRAAMMALPLVAVAGLFAFYGSVFGDPLAAFRWNVGERGMLGMVPYAGVFLPEKLGNFRAAELYVILHLTYAYGTACLRRHRDILVPTLVYLVFATFLVDRDITRFLLPIAPFALLVGLDDVLSRPTFRALAPLVALLGHAYAWHTLPENMISPAGYEQLLPLLSR
jgi:hypothetical protein